MHILYPVYSIPKFAPYITCGRIAHPVPDIRVAVSLDLSSLSVPFISLWNGTQGLETISVRQQHLEHPLALEDVRGV